MPEHVVIMLTVLGPCARHRSNPRPVGRALRIRPEQLRALESVQAESSERRILSRLLGNYPSHSEDLGEQYVTDLLREAFERAPGYELVTELDLYRLTALMLERGPWFDRDGRRPWIESMLGDERFDGTTRLDRVLARLAQEEAAAGE